MLFTLLIVKKGEYIGDCDSRICKKKSREALFPHFCFCAILCSYKTARLELWSDTNQDNQLSNNEVTSVSAFTNENNKVTNETALSLDDHFQIWAFADPACWSHFAHLQEITLYTKHNIGKLQIQVISKQGKSKSRNTLQLSTCSC